MPGSAEDPGDGWTASEFGSTAGLSDGLAALASGAVERAVDRLIGVGGGLIPAGDDVLAGALAALAAWAPDSPARSALVRATATALGTVKPTELTADSPSPTTPSADPATAHANEVPSPAAATGRTTPVSAALLQSAATGFAIPEVVDYLTALSTPGSDIDQAHARLATITLNSGPAIVLGIHHQLQALQTGATQTPP